MKTYRISVVVPTYERRETVVRALQSLAAQTLCPDDYEVIVVIDGSEDGTHEALITFSAPHSLRAIWQPNQGRATACNTGIRAATGEWVLIVDDDMELEPDCLEAHLRAHAEGFRLGVVGAMPVVLDESATPVATFVAAKFSRIARKLREQENETLHFRDFSTANFSIRRSILLEVGLFDEEFKVYGNEDTELGLRLIRAGVQLVYRLEAVARQHYEKDFAGLAADNVAKGRTAVLLASKYPETWEYLRLSTYEQYPLRWRVVRKVLLDLSRVCKGMPDRVVRFVQWLERRQPRRMPIYYDLAVDYFFWLGARSALGEKLTARNGRPVAASPEPEG